MSSSDRWWAGAALYQVYVRSWQDTDGDGYGDLAGVRRRLDHLSWLGVDGLWLSPTMPSPDEDWGYDVSDYYGVHPELGTLEDLDALVAAAADRGIRVLLDLVPNHTSALHPWFVEARSSRSAPHRDWYVWADPGPDGGPPNNWRSAEGSSAWSLDEATGQYYLHNFLPGQPDLDWWNTEVHAEFERILHFWFGRGIAGFRIDVAHSLYKDRQLRDDSPAPKSPAAPHGLAADRSMNQPEVHDVYRAWRKLAEGYDPARLLLGETWVFGADRLASYYGRDDELQLAFNFPFVFSPLRAGALSEVVGKTLAALPTGACPVWVGSNHDVSRFPTRWAAGDRDRARAALVVLATLPGTVVLYYGDELGLTDVPVPPEDQRDPMSWRASDGRFNRDRARTPMPWEPGPLYGFAPEGTRPWLPVGDRDGLTVAEQRDDPRSNLSLTRDLLALRRRWFGGRVASYSLLPSGADQWVYRSGPLVVAANLSPAEATVEVPAGDIAISSIPGAAPDQGWLHLRPYEAVVVVPEEAAG